MEDKLWCDLKTDYEKAEFLRSGQAWKTGIISQAIADEVAEVFMFRWKRREIKFRAWDIENEIICQVYRLEWVDGKLFAGCIPHSGNMKRVLNTEENPLIEYTGLKDKTGKEIFEGDIFSWLGHEVKAGKQIRPERIEEVKWDFYNLHRLENLTKGNRTVEIIGNIYENPELLEE